MQIILCDEYGLLSLLLMLMMLLLFSRYQTQLVIVVDAALAADDYAILRLLLRSFIDCEIMLLVAFTVAKYNHMWTFDKSILLINVR